jgi:transcriptional regulator with XRE-family HTH domain
LMSHARRRGCQMKITGAQAKAARLLLGWDLPKMAAEAHLDRRAISNFESRTRTVSAAANAEIRYALEKAGIEFSDDNEPGVRLTKAR